MPRRSTFAFAPLSALTGCISQPLSGPLVEYRAGLTPITRPVRCEATYALVPQNTPVGGPPLAEHHAAKGERLGFRREPDGSVSAIAPALTRPLPPGAFAWEVVPGSVPSWVTRAKRELREAGKGIAHFAGLAGLFGLESLIEETEPPPTPPKPTFEVDYYPNRNVRMP